MCELNEEVSLMSCRTLHSWSEAKANVQEIRFVTSPFCEACFSVFPAYSNPTADWRREEESTHSLLQHRHNTCSQTVSVQLWVASLTFNASTENMLEISYTCCCYCELWTGQEIPGQHGQPALQTSLQSPWRYPSGSSAWTTCSDSRDPQQTVSKHTGKKKKDNFRT